ncbi:hypothetical protein C7402_10388 [Paraburkholderia unamae]|uniref:Uncharacterized protein n=1 Tax=Paraburkholderia unamae TaxID=219649 RepID=A0ABX5KTB3_9BURK|nr:hypothetical protein C7402_10388 [Paraburkholderia unamae]
MPTTRQTNGMYSRSSRSKQNGGIEYVSIGSRSRHRWSTRLVVSLVPWSPSERIVSRSPVRHARGKRHCRLHHRRSHRFFCALTPDSARMAPVCHDWINGRPVDLFNVFCGSRNRSSARSVWLGGRRNCHSSFGFSRHDHTGFRYRRRSLPPRDCLIVGLLRGGHFPIMRSTSEFGQRYPRHPSGHGTWTLTSPAISLRVFSAASDSSALASCLRIASCLVA